VLVFCLVEWKNLLLDYQRLEAQDRYESADLDDEYQDERGYDKIMADRRAAEAELDARHGVSVNRKLPRILRDQVLVGSLDFLGKRF
jgi:DNA replication licensing factor MCM2